MMIRFAALVLIAAASAFGCNGRSKPPQAANNTANRTAPPATSASASANAGADARGASNANTANGNTPPDATPRLEGTFVVSEVQKEGVINIVTMAKTYITFFRDGSYMRISQRKGKTVHTDTGVYRTDGDKLVLMIQLGDGTIYNPPREVAHTYSLSSDGQELKLTSSKGNLAIFKKSSSPPPT